MPGMLDLSYLGKTRIVAMKLFQCSEILMVFGDNVLKRDSDPAVLVLQSSQIQRRKMCVII